MPVSRNPNRHRGRHELLALKEIRLTGRTTDPKMALQLLNDFYFQAFNGSVSLPVAGYNYNSDWTPLLAGLSPAGIAASLAARSFATDPSRTNIHQRPLCAESDIARVD